MIKYIKKCLAYLLSYWIDSFTWRQGPQGLQMLTSFNPAIRPCLAGPLMGVWDNRSVAWGSGERLWAWVKACGWDVGSGRWSPYGPVLGEDRADSLLLQLAKVSGADATASVHVAPGFYSTSRWFHALIKMNEDFRILRHRKKNVVVDLTKQIKNLLVISY